MHVPAKPNKGKTVLSVSKVCQFKFYTENNDWLLVKVVSFLVLIVAGY